MNCSIIFITDILPTLLTAEKYPVKHADIETNGKETAIIYRGIDEIKLCSHVLDKKGANSIKSNPANKLKKRLKNKHFFTAGVTLVYIPRAISSETIFIQAKLIPDIASVIINI